MDALEYGIRGAAAASGQHAPGATLSNSSDLSELSGFRQSVRRACDLLPSSPP